jgi:hypothetical protein
MTVATCLLAAVLVLGTASGPATAVVCIGSDGHVDVESIFDPCCTAGTPHDGAGAPDLGSAAGSCGDCVDVELKLLPVESNSTRLLSSETIAETCPPVLGHDAAGGTLPAGPSTRMGQRSRLLDCIGSVVLLT